MTTKKYNVYRILIVEILLRKVNVMKKIIMCLLSIGLMTGCVNQEKEYLSVLEIQEMGLPVDRYASINNSTSDYYNWLTNFDLSQDICEHLHLNLEGEAADQLNQYFDEYYKKLEEKTFAVQFIAGWEETFEDILCLTVRKRTSASGDMYKMQWIESYNIDLETGQLLTNEELLKRFGLDFDTAQSIIDAQLEEEGIDVMKENEIILSKSDNMKLKISNDSFLTIDEHGNLYIIVNIHTKEFSMFDSYPDVDFLRYYFIKLN